MAIDTIVRNLEMNYPAASRGVSKARQQHEMNHPAVSCGAINEEQKIVTLFDFDHHDNVYKT